MVLIAGSFITAACTTPQANPPSPLPATPPMSPAQPHPAVVADDAHRNSLSAYLPIILGAVRVVAVGDVMMHADVVQSSQNQTNGFQDLWSDVSPLFKDADIVFGNLETPVAPDTGRKARPFMFNAPATLPAALKASGWTVLSTANNHAFDQGTKGVKETVDRLHAAQLVTIGTGATESDAEQTQFIERNGVKVAFIGFTDIFNIDLDSKATGPWVRKLDLDSALAAVKAARAHADAVIVSIHWGDEYHHQPNMRQQHIAAALIRGGADVVLGHHPHVLQPAEVIEATDEQGNKREGLVIYSLGNFISNQDRQYRADLFPVAAGDDRDGAALQFSLEKVRQPDGHETVILGNISYEPLWVENNWYESRANKNAKRDIHVIRIREAIDKTWTELDQLTDNAEGSKLIPDDKARQAAIAGKEEYLRTLLLRKARIAAIVGSEFEAR
ncbi:MAG TPA: CapA family protein [Steroidobacteraceae bacterium]|nr:CapA family protein [Steroidobacteraceae bacterium]